jgi:hypothetical protein
MLQQAKVYIYIYVEWGYCPRQLVETKIKSTEKEMMRAGRRPLGEKKKKEINKRKEDAGRSRQQRKENKKRKKKEKEREDTGRPRPHKEQKWNLETPLQSSCAVQI